MTTIDLPIPSPAEAQAARKLTQEISAFVPGNAKLQVQITGVDQKSHVIDLPASALALILKVLKVTGESNAIALMPLDAMLTTQQAADFLGVSRPFVIKEITAGKIPSMSVGTHNRIQYGDLLKYQAQCRAMHDELMNELAAQTQEFERES